MSPLKSSAILLLALLSATPELSADCSVGNGVSLPAGVTSIGFVGQGVSGAQMNSAVGKWTNVCSGGGSDFPALLANAEAAMRVDVVHHNTQNTTGALNGCEQTNIHRNAQGQQTGATIHLWNLRKDGSPCQVDVPNLIAHGIGHALGLNDVLASSCAGTIMGTPPAQGGYTVTQEYCQELDGRWRVPGEMGGSTGDLDPAENDVPPGNGENSPILIDLQGDGFKLSGPWPSVRFDIDADGELEELSWTRAYGDDAFLALDRNGNGVIDSGYELFGTVAPQPPSEDPNGFAALRVFDDDHDLLLTPADAMFAHLLLWRDSNRDGISQPNELTPLAGSGVTEIALEPVVSNRRDRHGNLLRWAAQTAFGHRSGLRAIDVIFVNP